MRLETRLVFEFLSFLDITEMKLAQSSELIDLLGYATFILNDAPENLRANRGKERRSCLPPEEWLVFSGLLGTPAGK